MSSMPMAVRDKIRAKYAADWRVPIRKGRIMIQTEDAETVPFVPNEVQEELIDLIWSKWINDEPVRIIIPKPRREGISTASEAIIYSITAFTHSYSSFILGYDNDNAKTIFEMTKRMHDNMELFLKTQTKASNAQELVFSETDSKVVIGSAQKQQIRGKGIHAFHGSEVAYYPNPKATMGGLLQSIPYKPRTIIILESTGNGYNWFEKQCRSAEKGESEYTLFFIPWYRNPKNSRPVPSGYDVTPQSSGKWGNEVKYVKEFNLSREQLYWRRKKIDEMDGDVAFFTQEYPANLDECFQASGTPVFDLERLNELHKLSELPIKQGYIEGARIYLSPNGRGFLSVWKEPVKGWRNRYCIGADTGGVWAGADYSVAYAYDRVTDEIVACIYGHFDAFEYATFLVTLAKWYGSALLAIEVNRWDSETDDLGNTVIDRIQSELKYRNLYTRRIIDDESKESSTQIGFITNRQTKQGIIDRLREFVASPKPTKYNEHGIISEMKTYIIQRTKTGKTAWGAQEGAHDDRVMAFGITLYVSGTMPKPKAISQLPMDTKSTNNPLEAIA